MRLIDHDNELLWILLGFSRGEVVWGKLVTGKTTGFQSFKCNDFHKFTKLL